MNDLQFIHDMMKDGIFQADLEENFGISTKNASEVIKNDEDEAFLRQQPEDPLSCSMARIDRNLTARKHGNESEKLKWK